MPKYPLSFESNVVSLSGIQSKWACGAGESQTTLAIPPEFSGPGGAFSPEDLFNLALTNCFVGTFKVYAEMSRLNYEKVEARSELIMDLDELKRPIMKKLIVRATITAPTDPEKARFLANKAAKSGFILNSVKTECQFDIEIL